ncbi:MAG: aminoacyl-tRNA hydrolase [Fibrobacterales bacterium]
MKIVAGLGNPGSKYANTRHNIGFAAIDSIVGPGAQFKLQNNALIYKQKFAGEDVLFVKPQTYMNVSGEAIQPLMRFYKLQSQDLIVFVDDLNLDAGRIRIRAKGSHGGQNGLRNIIQHLGDQFTRVRLGVGIPRQGEDISRFVLSKPRGSDAEACESAIYKCDTLLETLITQGIEKAMGSFNS